MDCIVQLKQNTNHFFSNSTSSSPPYPTCARLYVDKNIYDTLYSSSSMTDNEALIFVKC